MPIIVTADFPTVSSDIYAQTHTEVMAAGHPEGMIAHCCYPKGSGISVVDIWRSREDYEAFVANRVGPALERLGIAGGPQNISITDLINADAFDFTGPVLRS
jgi:hypothetical protein